MVHGKHAELDQGPLEGVSGLDCPVLSDSDLRQERQSQTQAGMGMGPNLFLSLQHEGKERVRFRDLAASQDRLEGSGRAFVSNAVVDGRYLLRACIENMNTTTADVEALPEIVAEVGRDLHGGMSRDQGLALVG